MAGAAFVFSFRSAAVEHGPWRYGCQGLMARSYMLFQRIKKAAIAVFFINARFWVRQLGWSY